VLQIALDGNEIAGAAGLSGQCFVLGDDLVHAAPVSWSPESRQVAT
jgi:hypothetical protein